MLTKRPTTAAVPDISVFAFLISPGTSGMTGDPVAASEADATRAWPHYRRRVWAAALVGALPRAAEVFDGLQHAGADRVSRSWQLARFNLAAVLRALEADRAAVHRFRERDATGAATIADFLQLFLGSLDRVETEARRIAASTAPWYQRGAPQIGQSARYGDAGTP